MMLKKKTGFLTSSLFLTGLLLSGCTWFEDSDTETSPEEESTDIGGDIETADPGLDDEEQDPETDEETDEEDADISQDLTVWFPQIEDTLLEFEGEGNEFASFTRYPQFVQDDTIQMVESTGGTDVVTVYEYSDEEVREIFIRPETYFREDFYDTGLSSAQEDFEILLQLPIEEGHSWESPSGLTSEITGVDIERDTPSGTVSAIEVTRSSGDGETVDYYGENVGLIETIFSSGDAEMDITSTLSSVSEDTPEEISLTVYSIDDQATGLERTQATMELYTNDPARVAMAEILRGEAPESDVADLIAESADINFMYLRDDGVVHADFSIEFAGINAGSGVESLILQGIVNTIGDYYQVDEVLLTVDGEPYESGHLSFDEGETMMVDYSNVNE